MEEFIMKKNITLVLDNGLQLETVESWEDIQNEKAKNPNDPEMVLTSPHVDYFSVVKDRVICYLNIPN